MLASNYPLVDVFSLTLFFALFFIWIILFFHVVQDVVSSRDLKGPGKASWILFVIIAPVLGCLIYVLARGGSMHERQERAVSAQQQAFEDYIRTIANSKE